MAKKKKQELELNVNPSDNILLESRVDAQQIKDDLEKYIDEKINKVFVDEIDKANKKLIREKSRKIFAKNIIIIILIAIIGFLVYLLYTNNYFDKFFINNSSSENIEKIDEKTSKTDTEKTSDDKPTEKVEEVPTLEELKDKYANLLDNYYLNEKALYLDDFYKGQLTNNLKSYLTLNTIDFSSLKKEDDYQIITSSTMKTIYEKLFDDEYHAETFDYNGNNIRYVSMIDSFITTKILTKEDSNIIKEIIDIKVDDDVIMITTIEGIIKDGKLYNILSNNEIETYQNNSLSNYQESLNKVIYTFRDNLLINLGK